MSAREGVLPQAGVNDARHGRIGREVDLEQSCADRVARQADVGDGDRLAVAVAAGLPVAAQMRLQRRQRLAAPVPDPFEAGGLIELEFLLEVVAHPRHDERMGVAGDDLGERPHAGATARILRQKRWLRGRPLS